MPLLDSRTKISVREHFEKYETTAYSRDQQPADIVITVIYKAVDGELDTLYRTYGSLVGAVDTLVSRKVLEESKTVFGRFNAESAIRERGRLNAEMAEAIAAAVDGPILILGVQVEDVDFSDAYEQSIEERMLAEVAVQRENQNLARERVQADIVRTQAEARADQIRFEAQAEADAIAMRGKAEAEAIKARAEALGQNPGLIELVKAERWDGVLPRTVLPNNVVPFIDVVE